MAKDLKFFMREHKTEIVTAPGPDSFKDENGKVIDFEIKKLSFEEIDKITEGYKKHKVATDKKGNPIVSGGEVVWKTENDAKRSTRHLIVEALQYPDLKDKKLMDYYKCVDVTDMPLKVFSDADEYLHVVKIVMAALGMGDQIDNEDEKILEDAKN